MTDIYSKSALRRAGTSPFVGILLALLAGCSSFPSDGPRVADIEKEAQLGKDTNFALVPATPAVVTAMRSEPEPSLRSAFNDVKPTDPAIGPGDVLSVTIFEAGSGGLFASATGGASSNALGSTSVTLPTLVVDNSGRIAIPYAGTIEVANRTPTEVGSLLQQRLRYKAMQAQVMVTIATDRTNNVTITGDVRTPGRYPLTAGGDTLMQMIATAGGSTALASDTVIELTRSRRTASISMEDIIDRPQENIHVASGDFLHLVAMPHTYTVFGAAGKQGEFHIDPGGVTLAQAIARAGGLRDTQADGSGVYVFRYEAPQVVAELNGLKGQDDSVIPVSTGDSPQPVIYKFNFKTVEGYFLAQNVQMRDKDLIYVSSAPAVDWQKFLDLFRLAISPATTGAQINNF
jgi:polysaccharide biosynthesis/export protein